MDGRLGAARLEREPPPDHLLGPLAVHLEVIGACNLTCSHCFAGELPRNQHPLSVVEMDRLFGELAALGSFRLGLTGGEPLLRKDLLDIVDAATARGLHPCLTTNALLVDEHTARELGRRELVWLNVSLEGARAETNDRVRGEGVFDRVLDRLRVLGKHARFTLAFTLTRNNVEEVEECVALARAVGAHTAVFRPLYPVGIAAASPALMPSFEQYVDALTRIEKSECEGGVFAIDPFSPSAREEQRGVVTPEPSCGAATTVASISVQGEVSPCSFLGAAFESGNIRARPFEEIWREGHAFRRLRRREAQDEFSGGCRARAQFYSGSAFAEDPWQASHAGRKARRHHLRIIDDPPRVVDDERSAGCR
jgi:radical SAM protein with 4Fe4S-binding SPASM domain